MGDAHKIRRRAPSADTPIAQRGFDREVPRPAVPFTLRPVPVSPIMGVFRTLIDRDDPVLLEIGCNDGQDTSRFLTTFPRCRMHCFEPDERPLERFSRHVSSDDPRVRLCRAAVGDRDGLVTLHLSSGMPPRVREWARVLDLKEWDLSSSIHPPTGHLDRSPWCKFERTITVPVIRLDTFLTANPDITRIDLIWADVQGAEADLILGATETLRRTRFLYTEFYDKPMYEGQPNKEQIQAMLPGWKLLGIYGQNLLLHNDKLPVSVVRR